MIPDPVSSLHIVYGEAASGCIRVAFSPARTSLFMICDDLTERPLPDASSLLLPDPFLNSALPILIWASFTAQELLFLGFVIELLEQRGVSQDRIFWMHSVDHDGDPLIDSVSFHAPEDAASIYQPYELETPTRSALTSLFRWWKAIETDESEKFSSRPDEPAYITECRNWLAGSIRPKDGRLSDFDNLILDHIEGPEMRAVALIGETLLNLRETCFYPTPQYIWKRVRELKDHIRLKPIDPGLDESNFSNYLVSAISPGSDS